MRGNFRRKNRKQGQQEVHFDQERFDGGWINDLPGSDLPKDTMALLENFRAYPEYLEGRPGTQLYSATTLPGSGTVHAIAQHPTSKKWVLHRQDKLYYAPASMSSWTEIKSFAAKQGYSALAINGDTGSQLSSLQARGLSSSNTNAGTTYWTLTNSGLIRTFNLYKDVAKSNLVATATRSGNGDARLNPANNSGIGGFVTITYTGDDTDAGNTITWTTEESLNVNFASTIKPFGNDFILFAQNISVLFGYMTYIDLTSNAFAFINDQLYGGYGASAITGSPTLGTTTPYGYRYLYTYSRIVNTPTGLADTTKNRVSGTLVFESASNDIYNQAYTNITSDYGEFWSGSPVDSVNYIPLTLTLGAASIASTLGYQAQGHYTHLSLYRTMDIGVAGVDPITGTGNNREIYVWVGDYPLTSPTVQDTKTDDELRANFKAGFGLKTRFWRPFPNGEVGIIGNNFIYVGQRASNTVYYAQLTEKRFLGFYNPAYQYMKLDDGVQIMSKSPDMVSFICNNSTYISSPNSYIDAGNGATGSVFVLQHLTKASTNIGCMDYGSFAEVDSANQLGEFGQGGSTAFIARCSDNTVRIWNNSYWSNDLSGRRVNKLIQQMTVGSVGAYWKGLYKIYYRASSSDTNNTAALTFGMSSDSGYGWSKDSGSALPLPQTYVGAGTFVDANGVQRMYCLDATDGLFYWIETFSGYSGASLTKYFLDKVATDGTGGTAFTCKARFREITGPTEDFVIQHKEAKIYDRPYDESVGFISGFTRNYMVYIDGSSTAASTLTGAARGADLQFFDTISGSRIQPEVQFTRSGARLTGFECLLDANDKAAIGNGPGASVDATNQASLAQNMKIWLTRPANLLNRASGSSFTLTGTAPTNVSGPDGRTYALSFVSGASYSLAETTSYTDFTLHFWVKTPTTASRIVQVTGTNSFYAQFASNTSLSINGAGSLTCSSVGSGWHDFWIVRSGSTVTAYQNGTALSGSVTVATARGGTTFDINPDAAAMILYDIRAYNTVVSAAAIAYYYADVTATLYGNKVLPLG
jgi:hypothetical protein